ncbi:MAG: glycosyltransferase [Flavobacteriaceae bacterium]|nr:glycosyltransferase [Flavobacteriaceae bacterium]
MAQNNNKITILYAYRNRDAERVRLSLQSLQQQSLAQLEVVFVDYGSDAAYASATKAVVEGFDFAAYYYIAHPGLLWNKSKALNYGIKQAKTDFVFIADVDIIFHPQTLSLFCKITDNQKAYLFNLSYLTPKETYETIEKQPFEALKVKHTGKVNGMVLVSKKALEEVQGLDEFYHFYGSEDVDLFARLEQSGQKLSHRDELFFKHQWHVIYNTYNDSKISKTPRLFNVKRLNQQHYFWQKTQKCIQPRLKPANTYYKPDDLERLQRPSVALKLPNILAIVEHFLAVELPGYSDTIISVQFYEDPYYRSLKHSIKQLLGKQTQPYCSMKQVNDMILRSIVFHYPHHNYSYTVSDDLKTLHWVIEV